MRFHHAVPALLATILASACDSSSSKTCSINDDCRQGGVPGTCRPSPLSADSFCSFPDPMCPSPPAERWGVLAGDALAKTCVDAEGNANDASVDAEVDPTDSSVPDAAATDAAPPQEFAVRKGGTASETPRGFTLAPETSITIVGGFAGTTDLGGGSTMSSGVEDAFVARYGPDHGHVWSYKYGAGGGDSAAAVATTASGDVIFTGVISGDIDFGGGPLSTPNPDVFVVRYSAAGEHVWSRTYTSGIQDGVSELVIDASGNLYLAGTFSGSAKFGAFDLSSAGFSDAFLVKLNGATGDVIWAKRFGGTAFDTAGSVAVRGDRVAIGGTYQIAIGFGGPTLTATGDEDGYVAVLDAADGGHVWSRKLGGAMATTATSALAFDADGALYVAGQFTKTVDVGGGNFTSAGSTDVFLARYGDTGAHAWSRRVGGTGTDDSSGIDVDAAGVTAVGSFEGTVDFAGTTLTSAGNADVFVLRLSKVNSPRAAHRFGGTQRDVPSGGVRLGAQTTVVGSFAGTATLDAGSFALTSDGTNADIFVLGLNLP
jgi:hypothetical protein